jgi:hypothetical protein
VTEAWLARSFLRGAPPGWDFGPAPSRPSAAGCDGRRSSPQAIECARNDRAQQARRGGSAPPAPVAPYEDVLRGSGGK